MEPPDRKLKILVVTNLFYPDRGGGGSVFSDLCFGLVEKGHSVTAYTTNPYYPEWKNKNGTPIWKTTVEDINGVNVIRYGMYIPSNPSKLLQRVAYESSFALSLMKSIFRFEKFDIVMVYCPLLSAVGFASLRTFFTREPLWLNVQDIPADAASNTGISQSKSFDNFAQGLQKLLFNRARIWSTISPIMQKRLKSLQTKNQPLHYIPNWLNRSMSDTINNTKRTTPPPDSDKIQLLYAGNIGKKQNLKEFCAIFNDNQLAHELTIHGAGAEAENLSKWIQNNNCDKIKFGEFLNEQGFVQALANADIFLITEGKGAGSSFIPSKLIPCIGTGTPVLAICDKSGPLGQEIEEYGLGLTLEWDQIEKLSDSLKILSQSLSAYQNNCLERSKFYTRERNIQLFEEQFKIVTEPVD